LDEAVEGAAPETEGRGACLAAVVGPAAEETVERRFLAASTVPTGATVRVVLVAVRPMVLVRADTEAVAVVAGFRAVAVVLEEVADGLVVGLEGEVMLLPGTVDVRRGAVDVRGRFFSSSEAEGCDLWPTLDVAVVVGFLTVLVVPAGGRVGGLVRPLVRVVLAVAPAAALVRDDVVEAAVPGRRTADVVVPGRLAALPSDLATLEVDFAVDFGESPAAVPEVPVVSSPERIDASASEAS